MPSLRRTSSRSSTRSTFTFRVAFDDIQAIQSELVELTESIQRRGKTISSTQNAVEKNVKEMKALDRKIEGRKKTLEKLGGKGDAQSGKKLATSENLKRKRIISAISAIDASLSITTNDVSIGMISPINKAISSPSPRKRKRFAGVWDGSNHSFGDVFESNDIHITKRARASHGVGLGEARSCKENLSVS